MKQIKTEQKPLEDNRIKIIIVDDHPTFRDGLCKLLPEEIDCIAEASNGEEAINLAAKMKPDVMLIDIDMPVMNGCSAAEKILEENPDIGVIMLSAYDYDSYLFSSLRAGARGFIVKTAGLNKLIEAVHLVHDGQIVLDSSVTEKLTHILNQDNTASKGKNNFFGSRELEILNLVARGLTNKEIAQKLKVSQRTVQSHLVNIFRKTETSSRTQAVYRALQQGWITFNEVDQQEDGGAEGKNGD